MIYGLAKLLSGLRGEKYAGSVLAEALWYRAQDKTRETPPPLQIMWERHGLLRVRLRNGEYGLDVTLMLGRGENVRGSFSPAQAQEEWQRFSAAEVHDFVRAVNDPNHIHEGDTPVVPGLLLLDRLLKEPSFQGCRKVRLRYLEAVYAEESLSLAANGDEFTVFAGDRTVCSGTVTN